MANGNVGFLKTLNSYAGLIAVFTFAAAILFWIFNSGASLSKLEAGQLTVIKNTSDIQTSLVDKDRDHEEFQKQEEFQNQLLMEQTKVFGKLVYTLESLDKKLEIIMVRGAVGWEK